MAKNASTARAAVEAPTQTIQTTADAAESRRTTGSTAGTDPAPSQAPRGARGTGAGAKAATGRSTRTSTTAAPSSGRRRSPAHTATAVTERADAVPPGTDWTVDELAEVRTDLDEQLTKLRCDYDRAMADLHDLQKSSNDGAGDDQADAGSKTFEREQELSIANNRRDLMTQVERALERMDKGTYGRCESCAQPIPKPRLQAFPSATLCVRCKQREERR